MATVKRIGKAFALSTAAVGLVVLVAAGWAARDRIREEWYLWRFEKGSVEQKWKAAGALRRMKSERMVAAFCREIASSDPGLKGWLVLCIFRSQPNLFPRLFVGPESYNWVLNDEDTPYVLRTVSESSAFTEDDRYAAAEALKKIQGDEHAAKR